MFCLKICLTKFILKALQGAARMALQAGAHPAQIKDAVTSAYPKNFIPGYMLIYIVSQPQVDVLSRDF